MITYGVQNCLPFPLLPKKTKMKNRLILTFQIKLDLCNINKQEHAA